MGKTRQQGNLVTDGRPFIGTNEIGIGTDNPQGSLDVNTNEQPEERRGTNWFFSRLIILNISHIALVRARLRAYKVSETETTQARRVINIPRVRDV